MKLSTAQVAQKLGISTYQVKKLVIEGKLTDVVQTAPGKKKHLPRFDLKQVNELKKAGDFGGKVRAPRTRKAEVMEMELPELQPKGLFSRLATIEAKLDQLIKLWQ